MITTLGFGICHLSVSVKTKNDMEWPSKYIRQTQIFTPGLQFHDNTLGIDLGFMKNVLHKTMTMLHSSCTWGRINHFNARVSVK